MCLLPPPSLLISTPTANRLQPEDQTEEGEEGEGKEAAAASHWFRDSEQSPPPPTHPTLAVSAS